MLLTLLALMGLVLLLPHGTLASPAGVQVSRRTCVTTKGCWKPLLPGDPVRSSFILLLIYSPNMDSMKRSQGRYGEGAQAFGREHRTDLWPKC